MGNVGSGALKHTVAVMGATAVWLEVDRSSELRAWPDGKCGVATATCQHSSGVVDYGDV